MKLSKEQIEKIYAIKEKLLVTFKASVTEPQKKRISKELAKIEKIIEDIENGRNININQLNIFSDEVILDDFDIEDQLEEINDISYMVKVETQKISEFNKDPEVDQIYSFLMYFEENFATPLQEAYLKLDYVLSKKRDVIFAHYDALFHLIKEFRDDLEVLNELKFKEQIETYRSRIEQQKKYFFVKLSEFLHEFKDLIDEILKDYNSGKKNFFNPREKFQTKYLISEKTEFEGMEMKEILYEALRFSLEFIEILRMPDFRKNLKKK